MGVFYYFELMMAGVILLTVMLVCGITIMIRKHRQAEELTDDIDTSTKSEDVLSSDNPPPD